MLRDGSIPVRKLNNKEMADLPSGNWKNPKVDTKKYYVTFTEAWEVSASDFYYLTDKGMSGQRVKDCYIVTNH